MIKKIMLCVLVVCAFIACEQKELSKEIVFVCTHGAARSPIAAAYFNKMAKESDLDFHAVFRGTEPDEVLTKETNAGLIKDGFDTRNWQPEKVSDQDIEKAYKFVTFDCDVPLIETSALKEEWNGTPSISKDYNIARDAIKEKVEQLIESLKSE